MGMSNIYLKNLNKPFTIREYGPHNITITAKPADAVAFKSPIMTDSNVLWVYQMPVKINRRYKYVVANCVKYRAMWI